MNFDRYLADELADHSAVAEATLDAVGHGFVTLVTAAVETIQRDGKILLFGNGGSAADAQHIATELVIRYISDRPPIAAIALTTDTSALTAGGNDLGFEHVFVRQLLAQARAGDALIGISTSGNSANLMSAFAKAKEMGLVTIGLAGGDGGKMKSSGAVDFCLVVPTTSIHRVQECHVAAYHILWDLVHTLLADDRGSAATKGAAA